jgi:dihydropteroate synthase
MSTERNDGVQFAPVVPANRALSWRLRTRTLQMSRRPLLMGIVNVTPDSFSDGGQFLDADRAVRHALQLATDGADILDIGGESTRPYAEPVSGEVELDRVMPVIRRLVDSVELPLSIDTRKASIAQAAMEAGAEIINDISGLEGDPAMVATAVATGAGVCVMHMQGTPQTMQGNPTYDDVVCRVHDYLRQRRDELVAAGVDPVRICLDPGLGFGKTPEHSLRLLGHCGALHDLGCPLLVGPSRKRFLGTLLGDATTDRTSATIGAALGLAIQGVQVLRVHDVRQVREALLAFEATVALGREWPCLVAIVPRANIDPSGSLNDTYSVRLPPAAASLFALFSVQ